MITNTDISLYNRAYTVACSGLCRYKFGAVIARRSKVISQAVNVIKTHPVMLKYGEWCISIHAEINAILKSRQDLKGTTLYIARDSVNPHSRPCKTCMSLIIESGIYAIVYHDGIGLIKERL